MTDAPMYALPVAAHPEERRTWAWHHKRGELKHAIKERILHDIIFVDGEFFRTDIIHTLCGYQFDLIPQPDDMWLPWCKRCAAKLRKLGRLP